MQRFKIFWHNLQQDLKIFLYFIILFSVFRLAFMGIFHTYLASCSWQDIFLCLWYGFRLSLKTAGMIAIIGAVFATIPQILIFKWPADCIRKVWGALTAIVFTVAFFARVPYFAIFNSGFNIMLINGAHDDWSAILDTAVNEYGLLWRLPLAVIIAAGLVWLLLKLLKLKTRPADIKTNYQLYFYIAKVVIVLPILFVFVRYGGAFNYANSINWESAERLKSSFLNENILDDGQAFYRVYKIWKEQKKLTDVNITVEEIRRDIAILGGNPDADTIEQAFIRQVAAPKLAVQPDNIVVILGESYALWPMLPKYQAMGLADEALRMMQSENSCYIDVMLAHGSGTMPAVNGFVTGLAEAGITEETMPESYKSQYATDIGKIMKDAGYTTVFWYGGMPSWRDIKNYVLAQNFDECYCASDFHYEGGNAWGCPDKDLYNKVYEYIDEHPKQKTFHLILTTSNHPPYTINVAAEGFDKEKVLHNLPDNIAADDETINELGHIWYADKAMGTFVRQTEKLKPDTLFVVTGDHAERFTFSKDIDDKTYSAIPCIIYGKGVQKGWLKNNATGCAMQILPTLAEIAGKPNMYYSSILPSLFVNDKPVFNHKFWAQDGEIYDLGNNTRQDIKNFTLAAKKITVWYVSNGNIIEESSRDLK